MSAISHLDGHSLCGGRSSVERAPRPWLALIALSIFGWAGCASPMVDLHGLEVRPNLEDQGGDGNPYTPETQSFLRSQHWLDRVDRVNLRAEPAGTARVELSAKNDDDYVDFVNVPLHFIVPCLYYPQAHPANEFDAYNLMLAEYSRNAVDFPFGESGDEMTHFETSLDGEAAWSMPSQPYQFEANPRFRPLRMSIVNNCLGPGLFEMNAKDNAGEIYHSWFEFPQEEYYRVVAKANGLEEPFIRDALVFKPGEEVELELDRLRTAITSPATVSLRLSPDARSGYSSQGSRKKLARGYVMIEEPGGPVIPQKLSQLTQRPLLFSEFIEPGKYSAEQRRRFDLGFLKEVKDAEVIEVHPKTSYRWRDEEGAPPTEYRGGGYLEIQINLDDYTLVLGNLPSALLVPQEDFSLHGFGVGIQSASEPAERRRLLMDDGPSPSFAYLCRKEGDRLIGVNSHDQGLEQVFLRTKWQGGRAWWEITLTSYERMVDLVKYEVDIPDSLRDEMNDHRRRYISPVFRTYQDDNVR